MSRSFIEKKVKDELMSQGLSEPQSVDFAHKAGEYFDKSVCNSRDPFKCACDFAGNLAQSNIVGFKYKSPKAKQRPRSKKPQEAFRF